MFTRSKRKLNSSKHYVKDFTSDVNDIIRMSTQAKVSSDVGIENGSSQVASNSDSRGPTPLDVRSMWDSYGMQVHDELQPSLEPSPLISRASSLQSIAQDPDLQSITTRVQDLEKVDFSGLSKDEILSNHNLIIKISMDLEKVATSLSPDELVPVDSLCEKLENIQQNLDKVRYGPDLETHTDDLHPPSSEEASSMSQLCEDLTAQISSQIKALQVPVIETVTAQVSDEFNHIRIGCVSSRVELKRSIQHLRRDMSTFYGEVKSNDTSIKALTTKLEANNTECKANVEATNTNFLTVLENFKSFSKGISDLSSRLTSLESSVESRLCLLESSSKNASVPPPLISSGHNSALAPASGSSSCSNQASNNPPIVSPIVINTPLISIDPPNQSPVGLGAQPQAPAPVPGDSPCHVAPPYSSQRPGSSNASAQSTTAEQRRLERVLKKVNDCIDQINDIVCRDISNASKSETIQLGTYTLKTLDSLSGELREHEKSLDSLPFVEDLVFDRIDATTTSINRWKNTIHDLQAKYYLHLSSEKSLLKGVELHKFSGSPDGENIYRFLSLFAELTEATSSPSDRALLLFNSYLSDGVRKEVEPYKDSFESMSAWLISRYGDVRAIAQAKLKRIATMKLPSGQGQPLIDYYKSIESILLSCESLIDSPDVNSEEVAAAIHNSTFVKHIVSYMPNDLQNKFVSVLEKEPNAFAPSGKRYFTILKGLLNSRWRELGTLDSIKAIRDFSSSHTDNHRPQKSQSVNVSSEPSKKQKFTKAPSSAPPKKLIMPCPFHPNQHNLGYCSEFFSASNYERFNMCKSNRVCFSCLSSECYKLSAQSCLTDVPSELLCSECSKEAYNRTYNVLVCPIAQHPKPNFKTLEGILKSYFKGLDHKLTASLKDKFNIAVFSSKSTQKTLKNHGSKSSPVVSSTPIPNYNTKTGASPSSVKEVHYPSREDPLYIFQKLSINNTNALAFYDSGATGCLVRGELAEACHFKTVQQESQVVGCLGDQSLDTGYGVYVARLGPDENDVYHEILFQGIDKITSKFPKYNLSSIANEVSASGKLPPGTKLPLEIGGQPVDILLGVRKPELVPKLLFVMPSGIGIFKAPFMDVNNSNICFGGTHYSITTINQKMGVNCLHQMSFLLTQLASDYFHAPRKDLKLTMPVNPPRTRLSSSPATIISATPVLNNSSASTPTIIPCIETCNLRADPSVSKKFCSRISSYSSSPLCNGPARSHMPCSRASSDFHQSNQFQLFAKLFLMSKLLLFFLLLSGLYLASYGCYHKFTHPKGMQRMVNSHRMPFKMQMHANHYDYLDSSIRGHYVSLCKPNPLRDKIYLVKLVQIDPTAFSNKILKSSRVDICLTHKYVIVNYYSVSDSQESDVSSTSRTDADPGSFPPARETSLLDHESDVKSTSRTDPDPGSLPPARETMLLDQESNVQLAGQVLIQDHFHQLGKQVFLICLMICSLYLQQN